MSRSRRSVVLAIGVSLILHSLLFIVLPWRKTWHGQWQDTPAVRPLIAEEPDTGPGLTLFAGPEDGQGGEEEQAPKAIEVRVDSQKPISVGTAGTEPGPAAAAPSTLAGGAGGKPGFFGVPFVARRVVFVVDRSLSMGPGGGYDAARVELLRCMERLPASTEFQVLLYNRAVNELSAALQRKNDNTLESLERFLDSAPPEGGTDHEKALVHAFRYQPDVIFLVTDADDLTSSLVRRLTVLNKGRSLLNTIDVSRRRSTTAMLMELALRNGGRHQRASFAEGTE